VRSFAGDSDLTPAELRAAPIHPPRPGALEAPLTSLSGVGPKLAEAAAAGLGVATVGDLLLRLPHSHRDRTVVPVVDLEQGATGAIRVEVLGNTPRPFRRGKGFSITSVKVGDESGSLRASWFNQPWVAPKLVPGAWLLLTGSRDKRGFRVSEYEFLAAPEEEAADDALVPVHPATEQVRPQRLRQWVEQAVSLAANEIEPLPAELRARLGLAGVGDAIGAVHFPAGEADVEVALQRLAFEELFLYQAILATRKRSHRQARPAPRLSRPGELVGRWIAALPFEPTADQLAAFDEIDGDLDSGEPMARLLMGEVGSGKTVVALYTMLRALEAGCQAVLMAPTETLAEQHAVTLDRLLGAELVPFALLTGATPAPARKQAVEKLASGELGMAIGTHALIEPSVGFARLGVCIVDEQHRFGVEQRRALDAKGAGGMAPHVLHMTATPIPRTLSLTAYGDLDTTALRELPAGRRPVETRIVEEGDRAAAYELLRERLCEGRQAYVVCPLVAESEKTGGKAAEREAERLGREELSGFSIGVLHGQMAAADKAAAMAAFASGTTEVLVATTVIEVGVDVANATVMVVEDADRFGLSQLHQLRGRVGRAGNRSFCFLFADPTTEDGEQRLAAMAQSTDGFALAEKDLEIRGSGEVFGERQSGFSDLKLGRIPRDEAIVMQTRRVAEELLDRDPDLGGHAQLRDEVQELLGDAVDFLFKS
jgi:ATP-dependent DNA helicase RecG